MSEKSKGLVIALAVLSGLATLMMMGERNKQSALNTSAVASPTVPSTRNFTDFERGDELLWQARQGNPGYYRQAKQFFEKISRNDPKYSEAQEKLQIVKEEIAKQEQKEKKKEALRKRYEKLCHSGLYLYQIEQQLQRDGFYMDHSGFEKAPDGSTGVRQYFSKDTLDGVIEIWTQSAYASGYHYCDVTVTDSKFSRN